MNKQDKSTHRFRHIARYFGLGMVLCLDETPVVTRYINTAIMNLFSHAEDHGAGKPLSEAAALKKANAVFAAAGVSGQIATPEARLQQMTYPPTSSGQSWYVTGTRQFRNIPVVSQQAIVIMHGETGTVKLMNVLFPTPAPAQDENQITSAQAITTATAQLATSGVQGATFTSVRKRIVQPNTRWQAGGSEDTVPGVSRVAWEVMFTEGNRGIVFVWVDAQTGRVIGGTAAYVR